MNRFLLHVIPCILTFICSSRFFHLFSFPSTFLLYIHMSLRCCSLSSYTAAAERVKVPTSGSVMRKTLEFANQNGEVTKEERRRVTFGWEIRRLGTGFQRVTLTPLVLLSWERSFSLRKWSLDSSFRFFLFGYG